MRPIFDLLCNVVSICLQGAGGHNDRKEVIKIAFLKDGFKSERRVKLIQERRTFQN